MKYEEYKQNLIQELQSWGSTHDYEISETTSQKVNGPAETITIKKAGENVAAAIYPKALYEDYTKELEFGSFQKALMYFNNQARL